MGISAGQKLPAAYRQRPLCLPQLVPSIEALITRQLWYWGIPKPKTQYPEEEGIGVYIYIYIYQTIYLYHHHRDYKALMLFDKPSESDLTSLQAVQQGYTPRVQVSP